MQKTKGGKRSGGGAGFAEVSKARLGKAQSPEMLEYVWTPYADIDEENVRAMIRCNLAHTVMLYEQRIITKREEEVLQLIADGCSTPEVAERLYISQKTVKNHLASIYQKLDARDRTQAVLQAVRMGIVQLH